MRAGMVGGRGSLRGGGGRMFEELVQTCGESSEACNVKAGLTSSMDRLNGQRQRIE